VKRSRREVTLTRVLKWLALGVAILLAAVLAFGNNAGSAHPLTNRDARPHPAAVGGAPKRLP